MLEQGSPRLELVIKSHVKNKVAPAPTSIYKILRDAGEVLACLGVHSTQPCRVLEEVSCLFCGSWGSLLLRGWLQENWGD